MIKRIIVIALIFITYKSFAQETSLLLKEATNLELKFKEPEALAKYKEVLIVESNNYTALEKATILTCRIGARTTVVKDKRLMFESALTFANRAFKVDSTTANSFYLLNISPIENSSPVKSILAS